MGCALQTLRRMRHDSQSALKLFVEFFRMWCQPIEQFQIYRLRPFCRFTHYQNWLTERWSLFLNTPESVKIMVDSFIRKQKCKYVCGGSKNTFLNRQACRTLVPEHSDSNELDKQFADQEIFCKCTQSSAYTLESASETFRR